MKLRFPCNINIDFCLYVQYIFSYHDPLLPLVDLFFQDLDLLLLVHQQLFSQILLLQSRCVFACDLLQMRGAHEELEHLAVVALEQKRLGVVLG